MWISETQVKAAAKGLDVKRHSFKCAAPRLDVTGSPARIVEKPQAKNPEHRKMKIPYGAHGADFMEIDPETLSVRCGACAGTLDATVREAAPEAHG